MKRLHQPTRARTTTKPVADAAHACKEQPTMPDSTLEIEREARLADLTEDRRGDLLYQILTGVYHPPQDVGRHIWKLLDSNSTLSDAFLDHFAEQIEALHLDLPDR